MVDQITNNNGHAPTDGHPAGPDAHGQAVMLLVESLIHGLIARGVIGVADAIEIVEVAADMKIEIASELGDSPATLRKSLDLFSAISVSLANDTPNSDSPLPTA